MSAAKSACVIGWPIRHSRSPIIHNYWLRQHAIAGSYDKREVAPDDLARFIARGRGRRLCRMQCHRAAQGAGLRASRSCRCHGRSGRGGEHDMDGSRAALRVEHRCRGLPGKPRWPDAGMGRLAASRRRARGGRCCARGRVRPEEARRGGDPGGQPLAAAGRTSRPRIRIARRGRRLERSPELIPGATLLGQRHQPRNGRRRAADPDPGPAGPARVGNRGRRHRLRPAPHRTAQCSPTGVVAARPTVSECCCTRPCRVSRNGSASGRR